MGGEVRSIVWARRGPPIRKQLTRSSTARGDGAADEHKTGLRSAKETASVF